MLERKSKENNFWDNAKEAGEMMKEMEGIKNDIKKWDGIKKDIQELLELARESKNVTGDEEVEFLQESFLKIKNQFREYEKRTLYDGEYDQGNVFLSIYAGAGGDDAQDWAGMLLRMYLRFCEKNNFKAKILSEMRGGEAGIKSVTLEIEGEYAYGNLRSEKGVHRLVRLSPFNADHLRQTSFALVEVLPIIKDNEEGKIEDKDLKIDTFKASGAGGQHVNTTDSAVRIVHLPTKIPVSCQSERSQRQNKEQAMKILKTKLADYQKEQKEEQTKELKGEHTSVEWGSQIRSYVLHPYKLVKDHRTKHEEVDVEKVLDGEIEGFIENYLRK